MVAVQKLDGDLSALDVSAELTVDARNCYIDCTLSVEREDWYRDIVKVDGICLEAHQKNPVVLWKHSQAHPIGKAESPDGVYTVRKDGKVLLGRTYPFQKSQLAMEVLEMVDCGACKGVSIGFKAAEEDVEPNGKTWGLVFNKSSVVEYSHVVIPANQDALAKFVRKKGLSDQLRSDLLPLVPKAKVSMLIPDRKPPGQAAVGVIDATLRAAAARVKAYAATQEKPEVQELLKSVDLGLNNLIGECELTAKTVYEDDLPATATERIKALHEEILPAEVKALVSERDKKLSDVVKGYDALKSEVLKLKRGE